MHVYKGITQGRIWLSQSFLCCFLLDVPAFLKNAQSRHMSKAKSHLQKTATVRTVYHHEHLIARTRLLRRITIEVLVLQWKLVQAHLVCDV